MAKSTKRPRGQSRASADIKADLKRLKKVGLYSGDLRKKEPTKYGKSVAKKFRDVLSGHAQVVAIPAKQSGRSTGKVAARKKAAELSGEFSNIVRRYQNKLIVRKGHASERASYSPSLDTIITRYKNNLGETVRSEYVRKSNMLNLGALPDLQAGESYQLPLSRGSHGLDYEIRASKEEILEIAAQYASKEKNPYRDAPLYIQVRSTTAPGSKPKRKRTRKAKAAPASNVLPFRKR